MIIPLSHFNHTIDHTLLSFKLYYWSYPSLILFILLIIPFSHLNHTIDHTLLYFKSYYWSYPSLFLFILLILWHSRRRRCCWNRSRSRSRRLSTISSCYERPEVTHTSLHTPHYTLVIPVPYYSRRSRRSTKGQRLHILLLILLTILLSYQSLTTLC